MVRAWLLLFTLTIGVTFNFIFVPARLSPNDPPPKVETVKFPYSQYELSEHTFWYFIIRYINVIVLACCLLIKDNTPRWLFALFVFICVLDLIHFRLFYRSEGSGYNILKVLLFGIPTAWMQLKSYRK
jgi:hypothetical protein